MEKRYVIGIDFGTLSGRAVLLDAKTGRECAVSELLYRHAVMDEQLPSGKRLPEQWALQHPADYLEVLQVTIPDVLYRGGVSADEVAGLGLDFTACTLLPLDAQGTPLCLREEYADEPHAYAKLWKHHAAQREADEITALAKTRGEAFADVFGGKFSSEWAIPKILQMLREAPELYGATARFCEAADWLSQVLTGEESRAAAFAGYKAFWQAGQGYPDRAFFAALDPRLSNLIGTKIPEQVRTVDRLAGEINAHGAALTGLPIGTPVALPMIDAHAGMPAVGAVHAGDFVMIIGTSTCHLFHGEKPVCVPGICGFAQDAVVPGLVTFEAGQACVGDGFAWLVKNFVPERYEKEAKERDISVHKLLRERASALRPGESGLLALDWWNGNRSVLNQADLSGMLLGMTLRTKPEEIYRAFLEATAFGSRMILEQFEKGGLPVKDIRAAGGIARKDPLMMQIYADVLGKTIRVADTTQAGALGSAMYAAVAGGLYPDIVAASQALAAPCSTHYIPNAENTARYAALYREYVTLHDYFGRGENDVMGRLLSLARRA